MLAIPGLFCTTAYVLKTESAGVVSYCYHLPTKLLSVAFALLCAAFIKISKAFISTFVLPSLLPLLPFKPRVGRCLVLFSSFFFSQFLGRGGGGGGAAKPPPSPAAAAPALDEKTTAWAVNSTGQLSNFLLQVVYLWWFVLSLALYCSLAVRSCSPSLFFLSVFLSFRFFHLQFSRSWKGRFLVSVLFDCRFVKLGPSVPLPSPIPVAVASPPPPPPPEFLEE